MTPVPDRCCGSSNGSHFIEEGLRERVVINPAMTLERIVELLQADQIERWRQGMLVPAEAYLQLHESLRASPEHALDLIYGEHLLRQGLGLPSSVEELVLRFPQFAAKIRRQFEVVEAIESNNGEATSGAVDGGQTITPDQSDEETCHQQGEPFGDYELLERIGAGGMGVVFKARQRSLCRLVALKTIRTQEFATAEEIRRFHIEAENAASLDHPHIVPIYEIGEHRNQHYFTMKLLDGGTLAARLERYRRKPHDAARLVIALARSVHHAHQHGILHRDLKPGNILFDQGGTAYVADFGLARRLDRGLGQTASQAVAGTPGFLAPEQAAGQKQQLTTAADIYGLGAILYALLTGRAPFQHVSLYETLRQTQCEEPVPPSQCESWVPRDLETVCLKCLRKGPAERYGSAEQLAGDLQRFLDGKPVRARPVASWERASKWVRRNPFFAGAIGLVTLAIIVGIIAAYSAWQTEKSAREVAEYNYYNRIALADREWFSNHRQRVEQAVEACAPSLRHWEWHHLQRRLHGEMLHIQNIVLPESASFSPDGRHIAVSETGPPAAVAIFDAETGERVVSMRCECAFWALAYSPDGRWVAGSHNRQLQVVDVEGQRLLFKIDSPEHLGRCLEFSPDGKWLAAGDLTGIVHIWDVSSGRKSDVALRHERRLTALAWSSDGSMIATCAMNDQPRLWSATTGEELHRLDHDKRAGSCLGFSEDGRFLAIGTATGDPRFGQEATVQIWNLLENKWMTSLSSGKGAIRALRFDRESKGLMAALDDDTVRAWRVDSGEQVWSQSCLPVRGHAPRFHPGMPRLVTIDQRDGLRLWQLRSAPACGEFDGHKASVIGLALSPDGRRAASVDGQGRLIVWDPNTRTEICRQTAHENFVHGIAFTPDGKHVITGGRDAVVRFWDATTGQQFGSDLKHDDAQVHALAVDPLGELLATGGDDHLVRLWDLALQQKVSVFDEHEEMVCALAFSPDGRLLVSGDKSGVIRCWDPRKHVNRPSFRVQGSVVCSLTFSSDGRLLAAALGRDLGQPSHVSIWDVSSRRCLLDLDGESSKIASIAFSPDGRRLVAGSDNGSIYLWETQTGRQLLTLEGHSGGVTGVAWSSDGHFIYSSSWDSSKSVRMWDGRPQP